MNHYFFIMVLPHALEYIVFYVSNLKKEYNMTKNNQIQLTGFLGDDAKIIAKDDKKFISLRIATSDSYLVKEHEESKWQNKETVWHNILVFRQTIINTTNSLKKGDKVQLTGSISYKPFKDEKGFTRNDATIICDNIIKLERKKAETVVKEVAKKYAAR